MIIATVFMPGSRVYLLAPEGPPRIDAFILTVSISSGPYVRYEVSYWSGGTRQNVWVEAHEIEAYMKTDEKVSVGFK